MKQANIISLFLILLNYRIDATVKTGTIPPAFDKLPLKNVQRVVSKCEATRQVFDHEGGAAGFTSNCVIHVWSDKDLPKDLKMLTPEQQEKVRTELEGKTEIPSESTPLDQLQLLQEEAANRHYMCMEAKRSILYQLKQQLPAGMIDCNKITQVLNDLKVSPLLETFINKVNGPMKEIVARIHALEQDTQMPETQKLEAIRKEKTLLTQLLDEDCKDDHPSIRFHNVGYLPSPELQNVKMTLVAPGPDKKIEFFDRPVDGMGPQVDYLRSITQAAAHHGQVTGQTGEFKAHLLSGAREEGGLGAPGVISFVPAASDSGDKGTAAAQVNSPIIIVPDTKVSAPATAPEVIKVPAPDSNPAPNLVIVPNSAPAPAPEVVAVPIAPPAPAPEVITIPIATAVPVPAPVSVQDTPIPKYWDAILAAETAFNEKNKSLAAQKKAKTIHETAFALQTSIAQDDLNNALRDATLKLMADKNLAADSGLDTEASIHKRYQDCKAVLKEARAYVQKGRSYFISSFPDKVYEFGKGVLKKIRDDNLVRLRNPVADAAAPLAIAPFAPAAVSAPVADSSSPNPIVKTLPADTPGAGTIAADTPGVVAAEQPPLTAVKIRENALTTCVGAITQLSSPTNEDIEVKLKVLFDEETIEKIPKVNFVDFNFYSKSPQSKQLKINKEKMIALLKDLVKQLGALKYQNTAMVKKVGDALIEAYNRNGKDRIANETKEAEAAKKAEAEAKKAEAAKKANPSMIGSLLSALTPNKDN